MAYNEDFDIPDEVIEEAEAAIEGIIDGSITVEP
jgi:hypothetical protein